MACRSRWHTRSAEQQETPGCECRGFRHAREFPLVIPYCVRSDESRNIVLTTESPTRVQPDGTGRGKVLLQ